MFASFSVCSGSPNAGPRKFTSLPNSPSHRHDPWCACLSCRPASSCSSVLTRHLPPKPLRTLSENGLSFFHHRCHRKSSSFPSFLPLSESERGGRVTILSLLKGSRSSPSHSGGQSPVRPEVPSASLLEEVSPGKCVLKFPAIHK